LSNAIHNQADAGQLIDLGWVNGGAYGWVNSRANGHLLAEKNINPIEEILKLLPTLEPRDQVKTWLDIQSYVQAKPRDT
jgi:hypothetical protein